MVGATRVRRAQHFAGCPALRLQRRVHEDAKKRAVDT